MGGAHVAGDGDSHDRAGVPREPLEDGGTDGGVPGEGRAAATVRVRGELAL